MQRALGLGFLDSGLLSIHGEKVKKYKLLFHNGSFKKKVLKYGTPKPRIWGLRFCRTGLQGLSRFPFGSMYLERVLGGLQRVRV